jgi:lysozyme family protein
MGFDAILTHTLGNEGGVTTDTGGLTNYGITQDTFNAVAPDLGLPNKSVKDLKYGEVRKIYESEYYKKPKIDQLPSDKVQGLMFDWGVNAGTGTAIKKLQELVGTKADGKIGKKTVEAVNTYIEANGEDALVFDILNSRTNHYSNLVQSNPQKYGQYEHGWMNRINKLAQRYAT